MAEGLLRGMLGGEEDEKAASTKAGPEAFAAAVAANIAASDPEVAKDTSTFLRKQTELLEAQRKSVEAEHEYFEVEWGPRLLGTRLRTGFQIFIALAATVIGIGVAIMIHDAVTSRRVIVDPFDLAPNVAARSPAQRSSPRITRRTQPPAGCHPQSNREAQFIKRLGESSEA